MITLKELIEHLDKDESECFIKKMNSLSLEERSNLINLTFKNMTCLLIACLKQNIYVTDYLLNECKPNLETLVSLNALEDWDNLTFFTHFRPDGFDAKFNITASALCHMCREFYSKSALSIIKLLVKSGANVNTKTETTFNSTPLM